jgi:tRNA pseudouridine38-40 synthase
MRYKMKIAYDGTRYCGWQKQNNGITVQESIEKALEKITSRKISITGSGRTDAGVHARGQVAHFDYDFTPPSLKSLNSILENDIRIISLEETSKDFHARFSAKEKTYLYYVTLDKVQSPFEKAHCLHHTFFFDEERVKNALPYFLGEKDFSAFACELKPHRNPIKKIYELSLNKTPSGFYFKFRGNGFLYKMVRNISGTLLEISRGKKEIQDIEAIFASKSRIYAGKTAAAHALFLEKVLY